jgi:D-alanyl-D-alanine carboxypeptidase (penicillin-binding protein 5/6)
MRQKGTGFSKGFLGAAFLLGGLLLVLTDAEGASGRKDKTTVDNRPPYISAILMEAVTGQILFEQDAQKQWPPASITKMMLMLLVTEKLKQGAISLTDPVKVSARASKIGGSQVYLKQGEVFTLEEMMKAIVIHSANDASEAVAEWMGGGAEGFVDMMNQRAREMGLKNTQYLSVHGLPPEKDQPPDLSSAYDIAVLTRELVKYPEILRWASIPKEDFRGGHFILENTNHLIGKFSGADGIKTGSYHDAGFNLAATAQRDGLRLISVTLGSPSGRIRFREAARLLSIGFNNYKMLTVIKAGDALAQEVRIKGGKINSIRPVLESPARVLIKRSEEKEVKSSVQLNHAVWAPLKKGDKLGELVVTLGDKPLGKFNLVSNQDVERSNILKRLWNIVF